jgi:hypothetical protein
MAGHAGRDAVIVEAVRPINALEYRGARYGLQTMGEAGGLARAAIIERH